MSPKGGVSTIVIHCSATSPKLDIGVDEIREMHIARGFNDVGYHLVIKRDGTIQLGRSMHKMGAHVKGHNHYTRAICLVGGVDSYNEPEMNFTEEQKRALPLAIKSIQTWYPDAICIKGHREMPHVAKACPCFDVEHWVKTGEWVE